MNLAEKIFLRCFTQEDREFLQSAPDFIVAKQKVETMEGALDLVEFGEVLLRARTQSGYSLLVEHLKNQASRF
jgi:hypothetical protein